MWNPNKSAVLDGFFHVNGVDPNLLPLNSVEHIYGIIWRFLHYQQTITNPYSIRFSNIFPVSIEPSLGNCRSDLRRTEEGNTRPHANRGGAPPRDQPLTATIQWCLPVVPPVDHHWQIGQIGALKRCSSFFISSYGVRMSMMPMK